MEIQIRRRARRTWAKADMFEWRIVQAGELVYQAPALAVYYSRSEAVNAAREWIEDHQTGEDWETIATVETDGR